MVFKTDEKLLNIIIIIRKELSTEVNLRLIKVYQ